jgi:uncharacterized protein
MTELDKYRVIRCISLRRVTMLKIANCIAFLLIIFSSNAFTQKLNINDLEYFETRGLNVMVFSREYDGFFSSIEAFAQLNSSIYYYNDSTLFVNLYVPSVVNWTEKGVALEQTGNFPSEAGVEFTLSAKENTEFILNLFVPSWAEKAEVYINNEKQSLNTTPNSFISLDREWKNGDSIRLDFHYDFYIKTMPDDKNVISIFYGPMLLAFETSSELILREDKNTILSNLSVIEDNKTFQLYNNGKAYLLRPLYDIEDQSYGVYATIRNY